MLTLNIQAPDTTALWAQLRSLLEGQAATTAATPAPFERGPADTIADAEERLATKTRTRKKTEPVTIEGKAEPVGAKLETPAALAPSIDDIRAAINAYGTKLCTDRVAAGGEAKAEIAKVRDELLEWLKSFAGVEKASDIPEDKRAAVLAEVKRLTDAPATDGPSQADLTAALTKLGGTEGQGPDAVFELLKRLGFKSGKDVPEDKRATVIAEINKLLGV